MITLIAYTDFFRSNTSMCWSEKRFFHFMRYLFYQRSLTKIRAWISNHDDVIKWKHFPRYWPFVRGIHQSPVNSPHKGQWRGALVVFFYPRLNKWLSKPSRRRWFETPSRSLWRHRNVHPRPNFTGRLPKPPLRIWHGWVITAHSFIRM